MPPTHPSQADVAAAYRTLIAHETEPKEQDFYRTRLQRLEPRTEPESDDFVTQLAVKQIEGEAAWWRSIDFDRNASRTFESMTGDSQQAVRTGVERVLSHLTTTGRLIPAGGMALTAERIAELIADAPAANYEESDYNAGYVAALINLRDALFPATEPAEAPCTICNVNETNHAGVSYYHPFTTELGPFDDEGNDRPAPAEPAEEETKAEALQDIEVMQWDGTRKSIQAICDWVNSFDDELDDPTISYCFSSAAPDDVLDVSLTTNEGDFVRVSDGDFIVRDTQGNFYRRDRNAYATVAASSPVVPAPTETGPWKHSVNGEICVASPASGLPYTIGKFNDHGDFVWHSSSAELPEGFAPFVAAEEG